MPYILVVVQGIPTHLHDLGLLLIDIAHLFDNYTRDNGWSKSDMQVAKTLLLAWRVRKEEYMGPNSSPLEHVAGLCFPPNGMLCMHEIYMCKIYMASYICKFYVYAGMGEIFDDIIRHGMHDVFWCYAFERMVSTYVNISSNNRNNEISYVKYHTHRLFTRVFDQMQRDRDGLLPTLRMLRDIHTCLILPNGYATLPPEKHHCFDWHKHGILEVSSIMKAKEIWDYFLQYGQRYPCESLLQQKGIAISKKKKAYCSLEDEELHCVEQFLGIERNHGNFGNVRDYKKILFKGETYKVGNEVVVTPDESLEDLSSVGNWKGHILSFFAIQHDGNFMIFFCA